MALRQRHNDNIVISMTPDQSRMARAALKWSLTDLAASAKVGRATAARFELGEQVAESNVAAMRVALETAGTRFIERGEYRGGVCPPREA
jgi:hypothetical protein